MSAWAWIILGLLSIGVFSAIRDVEKARDRDAPLRSMLLSVGLLAFWCALWLVYANAVAEILAKGNS